MRDLRSPFARLPARRRAAGVVTALALSAAGLVSARVAAAPGQTPPPPPGVERHDRGNRPDRADRPDRPERREPTEAEWDQTVSFLREHSPRRLELFEYLAARWKPDKPDKGDGDKGDPADKPEDAGSPNARGRGARARAYIFGRVESLRQLQDRDATLYDFSLGQFELEDRIIGGVLDARRAAGDAAGVALARGQTDAALRQYVENGFAEREARIERLRQDLAAEQRRLDDDRADTAAAVQRLRERYERLVPPVAPTPPATRPSGG